jgi:23S rRNA pseudouridine1911/1915/1917 synthase
MMVHPKGKEALTRFRLLEQFRSCALLDVNILTGRTHQIRVHFASAGHPLVIDSIYGGRESFLLSSIKKKYNQSEEIERPTMTRLSLHAHALMIAHPTSGSKMTFTSPLPHDFETVLKLLRKYDV